MKYCPPIRRVTRGKNHHYQDADGRRVPGVTTILGAGLPKPQLINWAASATAQGAIDNWDSLSELPPAARLKALEGIRYEITNRAKGKGTQVHLYAEAIVQGIAVTGIPDELRPYIDNYVRFIDAWQLDPALVEVVVVNYTHGYAGTLDLIADLTGPTGEREQLTTFRIAQKIYEYEQDKDGLILPALRLPTASTARVIWDSDQ